MKEKFFLASNMSKDRLRSQSLKKHHRPGQKTFAEEEEDGNFVQIFIKKDHLQELQSILTIQRNSKDISPEEITSLCGILADCGILENKEN